MRLSFLNTSISIDDEVVLDAIYLQRLNYCLDTPLMNEGDWFRPQEIKTLLRPIFLPALGSMSHYSGVFQVIQIVDDSNDLLLQRVGSVKVVLGRHLQLG